DHRRSRPPNRTPRTGPLRPVPRLVSSLVLPRHGYLERLGQVLEELRARLNARLEAPDRDEAHGCRLVVRVAAIIGSEGAVVQRFLRAPADDGRLPAVQPHADSAGDVALRARDVRGDILVVGAEPEAVVDEFGVFGGDELLELDLLLRKGHR